MDRAQNWDLSVMYHRTSGSRLVQSLFLETMSGFPRISSSARLACPSTLAQSHPSRSPNDVPTPISSIDQKPRTPSMPQRAWLQMRACQDSRGRHGAGCAPARHVQRLQQPVRACNTQPMSVLLAVCPESSPKSRKTSPRARGPDSPETRADITARVSRSGPALYIPMRSHPTH